MLSLQLLGKLKKSIVEKKDKYSLGIAFVTFKTKRMADEIEQAFGGTSSLTFLKIIKSVAGQGLSYKYLQDGIQREANVTIYRAPDPNDIIWGNLGATSSERFKKRLITFSITFLLLCCSFGAILGLKIAQYVLYTSNQIEAAGLRVISILITLVISGINFALAMLIRKLTALEKHDSESSYFRSLMMKSVIARLVNTNLLVIIAHVAVYEPRKAIYGKG